MTWIGINIWSQGFWSAQSVIRKKNAFFFWRYEATIISIFVKNNTTEATSCQSPNKSWQPCNFRSLRLLHRLCTQTWLRIILDFPVLAEGFKRLLSCYKGILCEFVSYQLGFQDLMDSFRWSWLQYKIMYLMSQSGKCECNFGEMQ